MKFKGMSTDLTRRRQNERNNFEIEHDYENEITKFADMLCKSLEDNLRKKQLLITVTLAQDNLLEKHSWKGPKVQMGA